MNQSTWERAKSLLADAATLPSAERERFIIENCSDPKLQREVLDMLVSPAPLTGLTIGSALEPGARLGPYVIERLIGRGGMGEVYKASDSTLNRSVAIKVLPAPLVDDPERQARFRREAQVLAALNHPNIAHIHGFEQSTGVAALVIELVEGPTLADRLRHPIPLTEVLSIARQIVDALDAAHAQAIIHRDLKPANIKVREDGAVKLLDFGLARTLDLRSSSTVDPPTAPTMSRPSTEQGRVLGTPAYMPPEQAVGKVVDKRADIWSFGCVLFEMLTGERAFPGDSVSDTLARVIGRDPDWTALPPTTPAPILRLLRRCLEKPVNRRLADIADARLDIEEASSPASLGAGPISDPVTRPMWTRALPWTIAAMCAIALGVVVVFGSPWRATPTTRPMALSVDLGMKGAPVLPVSSAGFALSPDGANVAFVASNPSDAIPRLYLRSFDRTEAVLLPGTDGANGPFFSPDSQWIAFFASGKLKKIAVTGGAALSLCDAPNGRGASWSEDGTIVFSPDQQAALWRVSSGGGNPDQITTLVAGEKTQRFPQVLPGGKAVLYSSLSPASNEFNFNEGDLVVQAIPNGARKVLVRGAFYGRYAASGHLLYLHNDTLLAAPFDRSRLETTGPARPVADGLVSNTTAGSAMFAVSPSGVLSYVRRFMEPGAAPITLLDHAGRTAVLRSTPSAWTEFAFAPDGQRMAVTTSDGRQTDIWVDDVSRDALERVTHFNSGSAQPVWTPDGRRITFASMLGEKEVARTYNLYWIPADGSGAVQRLTTSPNLQTPGSWHKDGRLLAFTERRAHSTVMLLPIEGSEDSGWRPGEPTVLLGGNFDQREPAFSPDGRWLAYESNQSGKYNVYVRPFPGPGTQIPISTSGGMFPTWSRTKPELLYATLDQRVMIVNYAATGDALHVDQPRPWPEAQLTPQLGHVRVFALYPDGERLVLPAVSGTTASRKWEKLELLLNVFDELRRIAPTEAR